MLTRSSAISCVWLITSAQGARGDGFARVDGPWWQLWNLDPLVLLNLAFVGWLYREGLKQLWRRPSWFERIRPSQAIAFAGSLCVLLVVLISPLDPLSDSLFSAHMVQHMLMVVVAAPLFVWGSPGIVLACGLSRRWRPFFHAGPMWTRWMWNPLIVWVLFFLILWGWHVPWLYQAALRDSLVHDAQHLSLFAVSVLFWRVSMDPLSHRRLQPVYAVPYIFTTGLHASALGIFIALSPRPWYDEYTMSCLAWGLTPLADQQLAGFIMWFPSCLVYPLAATAGFAHWLVHASDASHRSRPSRALVGR